MAIKPDRPIYPKGSFARGPDEYKRDMEETRADEREKIATFVERWLADHFGPSTALGPDPADALLAAIREGRYE